MADFAEQLDGGRPDYGVVQTEYADGEAQQGAAGIFDAGVASEFRRPFQAGLQGGLYDELVQAEVDVGGAFRQLAVGFQDAVAEQDAELGEMARGRCGIHRVDGGGVAGGGVDEEDRGTESFLQILGDDSGCVAADCGVGAVQNGAVNGVIGGQRDERAIGALEAEEADLPVHGAVGIEAETYFAVDVFGAAVDVGQGHSESGAQAGGLQLASGVFDCLDYG